MDFCDKCVNWKLCESFSIDNAALLIAGYLPDEYPYAMQHWQVHELPDGVNAIHTALITAIKAGSLKATIKCRATDTGHLVEWEEGWQGLSSKQADDYNEQNIDPFGRVHPKYYYQPEMDYAGTMISFSELKAWLLSRGYYSAFFTPELEPPVPPWELPSQEKTISYLDRNNPYFSIKLKAAIDVWEAVSNNPPKSTSPKEAIKAWLREHANSYELMKDDGTPNETAIEEIAKIVHWRGKGGAIKMPVIHSPEPQF